MRPPPPAAPPLPARSGSRVGPLPLVFRGADGKFIVSGTAAQTSSTNIGQGQTTTSSDDQIRKPETGKSQVQTRITDDGHVQTTITYNGKVVVQKTTANAEEASSCSDVPTSVESGAQDSRQPIGMQHATFAEAKPFTLQPAPVPRRKKKTTTIVLDVPEQKPSFEAAPRVRSQVAKLEEAVSQDFDVGYDTEAQVPRGWI
ncbi:hypothetical protein LTR10_015399 [Elasticomyces elasticus]|nr:hypothetical protein LTR10_015399 [Elasticomyces elasticus]